MMRKSFRCPKCGENHIEEFSSDVYWFLCHDCGYNSPVYFDEEEAISAFCKGLVSKETN